MPFSYIYHSQTAEFTGTDIKIVYVLSFTFETILLIVVIKYISMCIAGEASTNFRANEYAISNHNDLVEISRVTRVITYVGLNMNLHIHSSKVVDLKPDIIMSMVSNGPIEDTITSIIDKHDNLILNEAQTNYNFIEIISNKKEPLPMKSTIVSIVSTDHRPRIVEEDDIKNAYPNDDDFQKVVIGGTDSIQKERDQDEKYAQYNMIVDDSGNIMENNNTELVDIDIIDQINGRHYCMDNDEEDNYLINLGDDVEVFEYEEIVKTPLNNQLSFQYEEEIVKIQDYAIYPDIIQSIENCAACVA